MINDKPFIVIDLYSGGYTSTRRGHEELNFEWNQSKQKYLGYCPAHNDIVIQRLGAGRKDKEVHGVMVIYVRKSGETSNREIIGFTENATIYNPGKDAKGDASRSFIDKDGTRQYADYCIESDTLHDLRSLPLHEKFVITLAENKQMFRKQRFYKGKYDELDANIIAYLEKYLASIEKDEDFAEQKNIQEAHLPKDGGKNASKKEPEYVTGSNGRAVRKKPELAKQVLKNSNYKCSFDNKHNTFLTRHSVQYMEGHHLIPCTPTNAHAFWDKYKVNIDCPENIVCICPTCHRRIHFGSEAEKRKVIEKLYNVKKDELKKAGIGISMEELVELYKK